MAHNDQGEGKKKGGGEGGGGICTLKTTPSTFAPMM